MPGMSQIHPTAIIGKNVITGKDNVIGPNVTIEDNVKLGNGNVIMTGAYIASGTEIGDNNRIHMHAVIGHEPQDLAFKNEPTFTKIGDGNTIREFVTIHRGTKAGTWTQIGNNNYIMAYCHIAHNCNVGHHVIMVNNASLTGHIEVEDRAFISGMVGFHQFCRVGKLAMVSALSAFNKDVPPFILCGGRPGAAQGINVVGMRRAGISAPVREEIKKCFKLLYRSGLSVKNAVAEIKKQFTSPEAQHLVRFIESSKRGIISSAYEAAEDLDLAENQD